MAPKLQDHLCRIGLLEGDHAASHRPLDKHVDDFKQSLEAAGDDERHVKWTISQVRKVLDGCGFCFWHDVSRDKLESFVATLGRKVRKNGKRLKCRSLNGYVTAFKSGRAGPPTSVGSRRRPLPASRSRTSPTPTMWLHARRGRRLIASAEAGPERFGVTGEERGRLYRVAIETGFRAGELQSLRKELVDLASKSEPAVRLSKADEKNRKGSSLPISAALAAIMADTSGTERRRCRVWVPPATHTAEMIKADLADARAAWLKEIPEGEARDKAAATSFLAERDEAGRKIDFHALRHTRGVWLFEHHKAHPREAQAMRVSSMALVERYSKSFRLTDRKMIDRART